MQIYLGVISRYSTEISFKKKIRYMLFKKKIASNQLNMLFLNRIKEDFIRQTFDI